MTKTQMSDLFVAFSWAYNRHRFFVGFCVGWSVALLVNTVLILHL